MSPSEHNQIPRYFARSTELSCRPGQSYSWYRSDVLKTRHRSDVPKTGHQHEKNRAPTGPNRFPFFSFGWFRKVFPLNWDCRSQFNQRLKKRVTSTIDPGICCVVDSIAILRPITLWKYPLATSITSSSSFLKTDNWLPDVIPIHHSNPVKPIIGCRMWFYDDVSRSDWDM